MCTSFDFFRLPWLLICYPHGAGLGYEFGKTYECWVGSYWFWFLPLWTRALGKGDLVWPQQKVHFRGVRGQTTSGRHINAPDPVQRICRNRDYPRIKVQVQTKKQSCLQPPCDDADHSFSVDNLLNRLALKYTSATYDVLRCNCNHFTDELCQALAGRTIPEW